jgi:hypothetical protein
VSRRFAAFALLAGACGRLSFGVEPDRDAPAPDAPRCPTCNDGLVAYWPFDDTTGSVAADVVGSHDAALAGTTFAFDPSGGVHGGAGTFTFGYASVAWNMPTSITNAFTVALWIEPDATSRAFDRYFSMFYWDGQSHGALLMDSNSGNGLRCAANFSGNFVFLELDNVYPAIGWRHAACTYDGSQLIAYANAIEVGRHDASGPFTTTAVVPVAIGASMLPDTSSQNEWHGKIDDVRVYGRALSQDELAALATP